METDLLRHPPSVSWFSSFSRIQLRGKAKRLDSCAFFRTNRDAGKGVLYSDASSPTTATGKGPRSLARIAPRHDRGGTPALVGDRIEVAGTRFRRQFPIGEYFTDFCCLGRKLIIKVDGGQHSDNEAYERRRTEFLQAQGFRVIRFWNNDLMKNLEGVMEAIFEALQKAPPSPRRASCGK